MQDLSIEAERIIAALRRRLDDVTYENAVLSAAVDQLQARLGELTRTSAG